MSTSWFCIATPVLCSMKSMISRLTVTGSRAWGRWPAPSSTTSSPPVSSATRRPRSSGWHRSSLPWMTSIGHSTRATQLLGLVAGRRVVRPSPLGDHRLRLGVQRPDTDVLVLLGRVRLGQQLVEEELDPAAIAVAVLARRGGCAGPAGRRDRARRATGLRLHGVRVRRRDARCPARWHEPDRRGRDARRRAAAPTARRDSGRRRRPRSTSAASSTASMVGDDLVGSVALDRREDGPSGRCPGRRS